MTAIRCAFAFCAVAYSNLAEGAIVNCFNASQSYSLQTGVTSDTLTTEGYRITYTMDKLFTGGLGGGPIGRPVYASWPTGLDAQAVTTGPVISLSPFALGAVSPPPAPAYQQPPAAGANGYLSARYGVDGSGFDEFVWDGFAVATTQTLREIQWRGTRLGTTPASFEISINTISIPGGTTWIVPGNASERPTVTPGLYDYKCTLPAGFVMTGGQIYWLQVFAVQNEIPNWQWSAATVGNGTHTAQVPAVTGNYRFITTPGDVAFTLLTQATVPVTIAVNKLPAAGGTVTGAGTYSPGATVTVTATPAAGRTFLNWTETGVVVSSTASFTFAADGNKTLSVNFSGPNTGPYVISAIANPSVSGTVGGGGTFNAGEIVDLDITAQDGYFFVGWTENSNFVNLPVSNGFFQVVANADRNLVANFRAPLETSPASSLAFMGCKVGPR